MSVYLDYNASAPIDQRVLDEMILAYQNKVGNADSRSHSYGENARNAVENARKQVANLLGISSGEVFFTSGATESNNIALQGLKEYAEKTGKKHIVTTSIEHKAILETAKYMELNGYEVDFVNPNESGQISVESILEKLREDTLLVSVMHVNNETGVIQPVLELGEEIQKRGILFHIDATQSCGKLVEEIRNLKYDMLSFSAHKLMGPQGVGALILKRKSYKRPPIKGIMFGGQQEQGIRPGTIPVALVVGCGKACEIAEHEYKENEKHFLQIKQAILSVLEESGLKYQVNGNQNVCVSNTLNIAIEGVSSEALMISSKQYCGISNGSACTSSNYSPSYVLVAMGLDISRIESSLRLSWGAASSLNEIVDNFKKLLDVAKMMAN
ncbi:aminotransferase class V-fold PLP-dependent enzyme [[Clostridium] innocuum]|nr:aminotransferase class V-fold PLP-dependent enzyme [Erysipelotrichaceae bacterium]MCR0384231.1 aminotransferase class V-fold PLP-dependent enzyme [[Clostridium] innocuum]MCR0415165.1 aminotransferase class V-fold PLP-dependent enzyme [[Clostridium] innocuum]MCR0533214.1 aminotransferase class V-fold PLP-dependent enzyme [[Clostridium] innocuum]MCR0540405.1 aminotransferase class V-fold PLP-dependent enzyme [[Clostridium] innocuum]